LSWDVVYYRQADGRVPVDEFLTGCPVKVRARLLAIL
jgi:NADH:ubiquinone oxidoreductase subunit B-like Fe-S oxidoreductase